ncbi:MAG: hypothetical protein HWD82_05385 [Flavobacteriaceae bacterium]|nr:hypothetical protein [Flavobacteriaceae bacterium]
MQHKGIVKNLLSSLLLVIFFIPIIALALHSLSNHKHEICHAKTESHIHSNDFDCDILLLKQGNSYIEVYNYQVFEISKISNIVSIKNSFLKNHQQLSFSLRGPPQNILA